MRGIGDEALSLSSKETGLKSFEREDRTGLKADDGKRVQLGI